MIENNKTVEIINDDAVVQYALDMIKMKELVEQLFVRVAALEYAIEECRRARK